MSSVRALPPSSTRSSQNLANEVISIGLVLIQHDTGCAALGKCPFFVKLIVNLFEIDKKISICPSWQINRFLRAT